MEKRTFPNLEDSVTESGAGGGGEAFSKINVQNNFNSLHFKREYGSINGHLSMNWCHLWRYC
jgi:hypothetical protein